MQTDNIQIAFDNLKKVLLEESDENNLHYTKVLNSIKKLRVETNNFIREVQDLIEKN